MSHPEYPNCERLAELKPQALAIHEFLEWLRIDHTITCDYRDDDIIASDESLICSHYKIDYPALQTERAALAAAL